MFCVETGTPKELVPGKPSSGPVADGAKVVWIFDVGSELDPVCATNWAVEPDKLDWPLPDDARGVGEASRPEELWSSEPLALSEELLVPV